MWAAWDRFYQVPYIWLSKNCSSVNAQKCPVIIWNCRPCCRCLYCGINSHFECCSYPFHTYSYVCFSDWGTTECRSHGRLVHCLDCTLMNWTHQTSQQFTAKREIDWKMKKYWRFSQNSESKSYQQKSSKKLTCLFHYIDYDSIILITGIHNGKPDFDLLFIVMCRDFDADKVFLSTVILSHKCLSFFFFPDQIRWADWQWFLVGWRLKFNQLQNFLKVC